MPSQRNGSGSQRGERWLTVGSCVSGVTAPGDQVRQDAPKEVRRGDPLAGVAPGAGDTRGRIVRRRRHPVARHPQRPAPGVGESDVFQHREPLDRHPAQHLMGRPVPIQTVVDLRVHAVWRATAAEEDPPVRRAIEVVDGHPRRGDELPIAPANLVPIALRKRLGEDDQRVHGDERTPQLRQLLRVRLAGEHDCPGANVTVRGDQARRPPVS